MCSQSSTRVLHLNGKETRTLGQLRPTTTHNDPVHDAGTQQRHQTNKNGQSCKRERCQRRLIKHSTRRVKPHLLRPCNKVIKPKEEPPPNWRDTTIKVIYRPVCSTPLLYKFFSQLLFRRPQPTLDASQSVNQAGFRPGHSTTDHLYAFQQLKEPLRSSSKKHSFDTVEHSSVRKALREQGIEERYIQRLTEELYDQQRATVDTDVRSKHCHLERGTKHGDPLSTLSFNSLLQCIMKPLTEKWNRGNH